MGVSVTAPWRWMVWIGALSGVSLAVDRSKFRTCQDTGFCRRHRAPTAPPPKFSVLPDSVVVNGADGLSALLQDEDFTSPPLRLTLLFYQNGIARMQVREANPAMPRWEPPDVVLEDQLGPVAPQLQERSEASGLRLEYMPGRHVELGFSPFSLALFIDGEKVVSVNERNLFHFEFHRSKDSPDAASSAEAATAGEDRHKGKRIVGYWEDGLAIYEDGTREEKVRDNAEEEKLRNGDGFWQETFAGHTDSKPLGPASVGMDIDFPGAQHLFGIPEHATRLSLQPTTGPNAHYSDPYRMYTLDVFEYDLDVPMALYGGIPMVMGHTASASVGAFWFNPTETFIDVEKDGKASRTHWISESGIVDLMLLPGPTPKDILHQFTSAVGTQELPPLFALGYHQCRWNYKDEKDVAQVEAKFEELDFPYDVLWLDIEHTDGKRYFTWDKNLFPNPKAMIEGLSAHGRRMVTIIDPHIKRDNNYYIHREATEKGLYIKNKDGDDFDGWCWPGSSSYLDFTQPHVREWWAQQLALDKYEGSTMDLYTWNDMNEPSVFNGPEVTMQKDCKNLKGVEHREWHNLYGMYQQRATAEGQIMRSGGQLRPFVLSRSFYAGSQRWGAIWTGDNRAEWSHLAIAAPMLLSIGLGGLTFAGADVGGFFGDPDAELMVRWMQAGAYTPFFRGHAHHDSKRREPWMFGEPTTTQLRNAVMTRYALLPYWYTLFFEAFVTGVPTMRPLWMEYPQDTATFDMDDQWLVGSDIVVKPVTAPGVASTEVYLPGTQPWYDVDTFLPYEGPGYTKFDTPIDKIAALQRGGSIIPRKLRLRRSSKLMRHDPYTLFVALDKQGQAVGELYMDDEETFAFKDGNYVLRRFHFKDSELTASPAAGHSSGNFSPGNEIERIVILGLPVAPKAVHVASGSPQRALGFEYDPSKKALTIRKPLLPADANFQLQLIR